MERRLLKQIINPAMMATWTFGILLVLTPGIIDWSAGWWHVKLTMVLLMSGFHGATVALAARFPGRPQHPAAALLPHRQRSAGGVDGRSS